jgi:Tfp pilus assembly protein PilO
MKSSDRALLLGLGVLGLLAALWFLVLAPKREEVSRLDDEVAALEASVSEQEQVALAAEQAKDDYERNYHRLVVLGKAVPADDDTASLIEQVTGLAERVGVDFRSILLAEGDSSATAPAAAQTTVDSAGETGSTGAAPAPAAETSATSTPAPASEAAAALLPIGATVGPAGLPVMPYDLSFRGTFDQVADFIAAIDGLVRTSAEGIGVDGRLLTIDGFVLTGDQLEGLPHLDAQLDVTSYVAPADEGLTGGATPAEPAAPAATTAQSTAPASAGAMTP